LDRGDFSALSHGAFLALVVGAPCFLAGAAIGRWWAPAIGLLFIAFLPLGDHCVEMGTDSDAPTTSCSGVAASDLPLILAVTTPCVLSGVAAVRAWVCLRTRSGGAGARLTAS
jgi:hypothetical protein